MKEGNGKGGCVLLNVCLLKGTEGHERMTLQVRDCSELGNGIPQVTNCDGEVVKRRNLGYDLVGVRMGM